MKLCTLTWAHLHDFIARSSQVSAILQLFLTLPMSLI